MTERRDRRLLIGSALALVAATLLALLSGPGRQAVSSDPRTVLCGADCFPVFHPWLLILAGVFAIAGLIGLRNALKSNSR